MAYKIHHLNTATLCPGNQRGLNGQGSLFKRGKLVCHCLLIETDDGLVLIDTGFGLADIVNGTWADRASMSTLGAVADPDECAASQISALGYKVSDVRHIMLTHLDVDHAGGIKDFPDATVHLHENEYSAGTHPSTIKERLRYRKKHWAHCPKWKTHRAVGESWHAFESVSVLSKALYDILLIPLHGHSRGHCGVAVSTTEGWLLHCGDAYFSQQEIKQTNPSCPPILAAVQTLDDSCRADRIYNQQRLRALYRESGAGGESGEKICLISSHDHTEFDECMYSSTYLGRSQFRPSTYA